MICCSKISRRIDAGSVQIHDDWLGVELVCGTVLSLWYCPFCGSPIGKSEPSLSEADLALVELLWEGMPISEVTRQLGKPVSEIRHESEAQISWQLDSGLLSLNVSHDRVISVNFTPKADGTEQSDQERVNG